MRNKISLWFGCLALLQLTTAHAYIGPGAGAGTIAIVLGILSSIFLAFLGILWYPFKRLLRKFKASSRDSGSGV
jgi:cytochrome c biogenesis factor